MELRPDTRFPKSDPRYHTANILMALDDLIAHLRQDTREFDEPKAQALFETSAEVLGGLRMAFRHYESGGDARTARPLAFHHAAIARTLRTAHVADPQATVKKFFPAASRQPSAAAA